MTTEPLDRERTEALAEAILQPIRANYMKGPMSKDRVYEALNALAVSAAWLLHGVDSDRVAIQFFIDAFNNQLRDLETNPPK